MELKKVEFTKEGEKHFGQQLEFYYLGEEEVLNGENIHNFLYITNGKITPKYTIYVYNVKDCEKWFKPIVDYEEELIKGEPKEIVNELYFVKKENEFMKELLLNFSKK